MQIKKITHWKKYPSWQLCVAKSLTYSMQRFQNSIKDGLSKINLIRFVPVAPNSSRTMESNSRGSCVMVCCCKVMIVLNPSTVALGSGFAMVWVFDNYIFPNHSQLFLLVWFISLTILGCHFQLICCVQRFKTRQALKADTKNNHIRKNRDFDIYFW